MRNILTATAVAGLMMGGIALTPAQAADLGGDCCADLEERVAELEATTVRKGNRKVSVKLSGQVNKVLLIWDDGDDTDAYIVDNTESNTRFRFTGSAKFKPGWSSGFLIEISAQSAAGSAVSQKSDGAPNENGDGVLGLRKAALYLKSDRLGTLWMGRYSPATDDITLLNIAGTPQGGAVAFNGRGFFNRLKGVTGAGGLVNLTLGALERNGDTSRGDIIRYDTPSLAGFVFSASWGEDDVADVAIRYKKEWNSIRVVGGIGYHWNTDEDEDNDMQACGQPGLTALNGFAAGAGPCRQVETDFERLAGSISVMHTPTGLYAYFGGFRDEFNNQFAPTALSGVTTRPDPTTWYIQAGIKRRMMFRELGATTIFGEYRASDDAGVGSTIANLSQAGNTFEVVDTEMETWGFGFVQDIDKAAMQLWTSFRHLDPSVQGISSGQNGQNFQTGGLVLEEQFQIQVGAKIKF